MAIQQVNIKKPFCEDRLRISFSMENYCFVPVFLDLGTKKSGQRIVLNLTQSYIFNLAEELQLWICIFE
ncbi:hypothetical protein [Virgibacillus sp. CBA3643]|uniref:hypothetical protein n=1 Tax=Virgibacillus sp. CBA3643 TaxID=2942278 RepID=UPI0035A2E51E